MIEIMTGYIILNAFGARELLLQLYKEGRSFSLTFVGGGIYNSKHALKIAC